MENFMKLINLIANDTSIPDYVKLDVIKRIADYCEAGGSETDPYIEQNLRYLQEVKNRVR